MIKVSIISFSYKRGLPKDLGEDGGGFVFDCRSLPNPYWDESLRKYTGQDEPVREFMSAHADEVAAFLGLSAGTLCVWRCQGKGPSYYKVGNAVRYKIDDVEAWKNANVKHVELMN